MKDCIFCKIAKHDAPATIELETSDVIAFKSIQPAANTHILIIPKTHIDTVLSFSEDSDIMKKLTKVAQEIIAKNNLHNGYKLVFNGGKYQEIQHVHWHLLAGELEK